MSKVVIVAKIKIKEEFKDEILNELKELHKNTHALDSGCLQYDLHKNLEDSNSFTFVETWENQELLDEHMTKEHFLAFVKKVENKLENLEISKLEKLI
uniref:putative quinol monooxygenase n=1 Tax=Aliarcobacter sp. TaxID=2321116 RepID=UPI0040473064